MMSETMANGRSGFDLLFTEKDRNFARDYLGEVDEDVPAEIEKLRQWVKTQDHFKCPLYDDFLLIFLRQSKFLQEKAKELLEQHVRTRCSKPTNAAYNREASFDRTLELMSQNSLGGLLPGVAYDGSRVVLYRPKLGGIDASYVDGIRMCTLGIDLMLSDPAIQLHGITLLGDYKGLGLKCYAKQGTQMVKIATDCMSKHGAHKMAALHAVNTAPIIRGIQVFLKTIMPHSLFATVQDHGTKLERLQKFIPAENLPNELGGTAGSYEEITNNWISYARQHIQRIDWLDQFEYHRQAKK